MERVRRERELETQHRSAPAPPAPAPAHRILMLQQSAGNAAVARMLAREPQDAPDLAAPAETNSVGDLSALLAHLQSQLAEAQQEAAKNQIEQRKADRTDAAAMPEAPAKKPGLLSALARPVRKLGAAMKKAGAWLGIGKRKPAAGSSVVAGAASAAASSAAAEEKEVAAMIGKLEQAMAQQTEELAGVTGSMSAAAEAVSDVIAPDEREQIVRQSSA